MFCPDCGRDAIPPESDECPVCGYTENGNMAGEPEFCGRDECPHCQGYDNPPEQARDCPWIGEELPDNL